MGNCLRVCADKSNRTNQVSMFDTPDLTPLCVGFFVALLAPFFVLVIGPSVEEKIAKNDTGYQPSRLWIFVAILAIPFTCCVSSVIYSGFVTIVQNFLNLSR